MNTTAAEIQDLYQQYVIPSYGRFDLAFARGQGAYLWDVAGRRYLDLAGGIAVNCLGHAHPELVETYAKQSAQLGHISNLYFHEGQGRMAREIVSRLGAGKVFFSNSGVESNEGLFKLARKFGHDEGRFEVLTAVNSFHGRTLAGIAATGQDKVKKGFEPVIPGFRHVPYNNLEAMRQALSPATAAILIEGVQGEGGVTPADPAYLLGLRALCDEKKLLLLMDEVQCGHFRTGRFHSFQRILEGVKGGESFLPDGISMAKSIAGGFPMGAFWVREPYSGLLGPGTHASTYGGSPLACAIALKVIEVIERDRLAENTRVQGENLVGALQALVKKFPSVLQSVRGMGLMVGLELRPSVPGLKEEKAVALQFVNRLHAAGLLTVPAGTQIIRFLPALNVKREEIEEGVAIVEKVASALA